MKGRIRNSHVDVEIEGDDEDDVLEQFHRDYPIAARHSITVEWDRQ